MITSTQRQARTAGLYDADEPLKLCADQPAKWQDFKGDGITFYEAASKILEADENDGERTDVGVASLDTYAFIPAPGGSSVACLATIPAPGRKEKVFPLREHAFGQLCSRVGAPTSYLKKLPAKYQIVLLNHGIQNDAANNGNTLRLAGDEMRALLSDRYAALDNHVVIEVLEKTLKDAGMLKDARVRSIAYGPTASMRITLPGDDITVKNPHQVGDIVEVGLDLLNGEIGNRSISISPVTWRLVCLNGMRSADRTSTQRLRHVGDAQRLGEAFRDAVPSALAASRGMRKRMVKAIDVMVDDIMSEFDGLRAFGLGVADARDVARDVMADRKVTLPEDTKEWGATFAKLPKMSVYDVMNGVTHVAQAKPIDRRLELEQAASAYLRRRVRAA